jgi:hypothetical protein
MTSWWKRWFEKARAIRRPSEDVTRDDASGATAPKTIDEESARALAVEVLSADGKQVDAYDVSVSDEGAEWEVAFVGQHPRAPGDEIYVYVHKVSGATLSVHGE